MFEEPAKKDIDAALSVLMHEARHQAQDAKNRVMSDAIKQGAARGNRVIIVIMQEADKIHKASIEQAKKILLDFIERMQLPATQITTWARPHLENLNNSVIGIIPPNGFPNDHQRIVLQYRAAFQQRVDLALRDVEIGYSGGIGFAAGMVVTEEQGVVGRMPHMPIGNALLRDRVTVVKKDGSVLKRDVAASVQAAKIFINDVTLPIERGDHILRTLPSKLDEDLIVTEATCYTGSLAHWEIKYSRSNAPLAFAQTIINNISGYNARVNINSTDNSVNNASEASVELFSSLIETLRTQISQEAEREKLIASIEGMRDAENRDTLLEKYHGFIAEAAGHMTIIAPFLPALTKFLGW